MKLLQYTGFWLGVLLFFLLSIWATFFYFNMLGEIYDSLDDGLEHQKVLLTQKIKNGSEILTGDNFYGGHYKITEVPALQAENHSDIYLDTLLYTLNEKDYEPFRVLKTVLQHNGRYYAMSVFTSMIEEDDLIEELLFSLVILYVGMLACMIALNNILLKKIWKPFYQLLENLKFFRLTDTKSFKVPDTRITEFKLLNDSVQKLLQRNIQTYINQRQFIENASHELQTPLAICLNKLELLVENYTLGDEEIEIISSLIDNIERLSRLNKSLLLLARIGNKQFPDEREINFNEIFIKTAQDFSGLAAHKNITISITEEGFCIQQMNPDLAAIVASNILKNAIVHNYPGGWIKVILAENVLIIENSGERTILDSEKVFERFQKGRNAKNSHGLGLSIVKAIADLSAFTVAYHYEDRHNITIKFQGHTS